MNPNYKATHNSSYQAGVASAMTPTLEVATYPSKKGTTLLRLSTLLIAVAAAGLSMQASAACFDGQQAECLTTVASAATINNLRKTGTYSDADTQRVGRVTWKKQVDIDSETVLAQAVDKDKARLVFIRKSDNDPEQTSANIAINNNFQISLRPGSYSIVESCVGTNKLSAHATGFKDNNLSADAESFELAGGQTYFIYVDMDEQGKRSLAQITDNSAQILLKNKRYQAHQVSRVVPNCPAPVVKAIVKTAPVIMPTVIPRPTPILAEKVSINLEVLFETDKSVVHPEYYSEIAQVAEFMRDYPTTTVTIEGHTDSRASDAYNQALSQRRVEAVRNILVSQFGITPNRLSAIGYGESQPRASNDTTEGRMLNRRVVAVVEERMRDS